MTGYGKFRQPHFTNTLNRFRWNLKIRTSPPNTTHMQNLISVDNTAGLGEYPVCHTVRFPQKGARTGIFKQNSQHVKTCILSKQLYRFQPNFAERWRLPNALHGWSKCAHHKSKMANGRHIEKLINRYASPTVWAIATKWHGDAYCPSEYMYY